MMLYRLRFLSFALIVSLALSTTWRAAAQANPTGTLAGTVSDPSGAMLLGVTVAARALQTGLTQTADA